LQEKEFGLREKEFELKKDVIKQTQQQQEEKEKEKQLQTFQKSYDPRFTRVIDVQN